MLETREVPEEFTAKPEEAETGPSTMVELMTAMFPPEASMRPAFCWVTAMPLI